jgi:hypothetical protein
MAASAALEPPALGPSQAVNGRGWMELAGENDVVKENSFLYWKFYTKQYKRFLASL